MTTTTRPAPPAAHRYAIVDPPGARKPWPTRTPWRPVVALASLLGGCTTDEAAEGWKAWEPEVAWPTLDCDPLTPTHCLLPYPNNVFSEADASRETGRRVALAPSAMPVASNGVATNPSPWNVHDGFSPSIPVMTHLPGASTDGLATPLTIATTLEADSPTLLLEVTDAGLVPVPHWVEIDATTDDDGRRAFLLRPAVRLKDATRYVAVIRGVRDGSGALLAPTPAFTALVEGTPSEEPSIEARRGLYADLFGRLEGFGVTIDELQLAWDFTTSSRENTTEWLTHMRDEAFAALGPDGPAYTIKQVQADFETAQIAYRIVLEMEVPLYLDQNSPQGRMNLGPDGLPEPTGTTTYDVLVLIPNSAVSEGPKALLAYGHGLLDGKTGMELEHYRTFIDEFGYVFFGVDFVGMAADDQLPIVAMLQSGDFAGFQGTVDRNHQAVLNSLLAMRMMRDGFSQDPTYGQYVDPSQRYYYGISQGAIFGATYMSLTQDVQRGTLCVGGQPYALLLPRSVDFDDFFVFMRESWPDALDATFAVTFAQALWDRVDPSGNSIYVPDNLGDDGEAPEILMRIARGDHQVAPLGGHVMARALGLPQLDTGFETYFGLEVDAGPITGGAMVEYDFGLPDAPLANVPMRECEDPHGKLRRLDVARAQLDQFFRTGEIVNPCPDGVCAYPEMSGCN
jgi:hypothetical protein